MPRPPQSICIILLYFGILNNLRPFVAIPLFGFPFVETRFHVFSITAIVQSFPVPSCSRSFENTFMFQNGTTWFTVYNRGRQKREVHIKGGIKMSE